MSWFLYKKVIPKTTYNQHVRNELRFIAIECVVQVSLILCLHNEPTQKFVEPKDLSITISFLFVFFRV